MLTVHISRFIFGSILMNVLALDDYDGVGHYNAHEGSEVDGDESYRYRVSGVIR